MIKIRKFIFEDEDIEVVKNFLLWIECNFGEDNDWNFLSDDSGSDMDKVYEEVQNLYDYMKSNSKEDK